MQLATPIPKFNVRFAQQEDTEEILWHIRALAEYEKRPEDVTVTPQRLSHWLFEQRAAEVLLAEYEGESAGYALFYTTFSSFSGTAGLYLEDLFIHPILRGKGLGKELMRQVAALAVSRGCQTMQWTCLDWNTPSIEFYKRLGAEIKTGNTPFLLKTEALVSFVGSPYQP